MLYLRERMNVHYTYYGDHFMLYVSEIIMLYSLNFYSAVCHLYPNKTRRKKKEIMREGEAEREILSFTTGVQLQVSMSLFLQH